MSPSASADFRLEGRCFLVAGGTRGIGRAISLQFARAGARVLANYVRGQATADSLRAEAEQQGLAIELLRADLTNPKALDTLVEEVARQAPQLDGLIFCAATGVHRPFAELTLRHLDWTFALNFRAFFDLTQRLLPNFAPGASIVAMSSQGSTRALPAYALVGSSKGALEALVRHMAVEFGPRGIRVNALAPGAVATEAWTAMPDAEQRLAQAAAKSPLGRLATVEDAAWAAQFLCSPAARAITGQTIVVDSGAGLPL